MRYQGGKSRIAGQLSQTIAELAPQRERERERELVSLFCGACSVEAACSSYFDRIICNDSHKYLIALLQGVQDGYELPDHITEEQYQYVKNHKEEDPVLTGFVGFGSSFGGKFFGGYGRSKKYDQQQRSHAKESKNALLRDNEKLRNAVFTCNDYHDVPLPEGCVVYADPPYDGTTQYNNRKFDSAEFWDYARKVSEDHLMFISELNAPEDFISVWRKPILRQLDKNKDNQFKSLEQLFIHKRYEGLLNDRERVRKQDIF